MVVLFQTILTSLDNAFGTPEDVTSHMKRLQVEIDGYEKRLSKLKAEEEEVTRCLLADRRRCDRLQWLHDVQTNPMVASVVQGFSKAFEQFKASVSTDAIASFDCDCDERKEKGLCECYCYSDDYADFTGIDAALDNLSQDISSKLSIVGEERTVLHILTCALLTYFGSKKDISVAEGHTELMWSYLEGKEQLASLLEEALLEERVRAQLTDAWLEIVWKIADEDTDQILGNTLKELKVARPVG